MAEKLFVCEVCTDTVLTNTTDEEALAEFTANFGPPDSDLAKLCDDCYDKITKWARAKRH